MTLAPISQGFKYSAQPNTASSSGVCASRQISCDSQCTLSSALSGGEGKNFLSLSATVASLDSCKSATWDGRAGTNTVLSTPYMLHATAQQPMQLRTVMYINSRHATPANNVFPKLPPSLSYKPRTSTYAFLASQATVEGNSINHPAAPSANTAADSALLADIARAVAHAAAAQQPVQNGLQFTPYLAVCSKGVLVPSADGGSARSQLLGWVHCMPGMQGQAHAQVGTHACASAAAAAPSSPVLGQ